MHSTGFLGAVDRVGILIPVGDLPQRGLLAVASPVALALGAHRIPAGFMLPVIVTAAEDQPVLGPDDLRPDGEARVRQAVGHGRGMQRAMPDIGDITREQRPCLAPVGPVVVQHLAGAFGLRGPGLVAPGGIVFDAVGRVGDHQ